MPTYDYVCDACGHALEVFQSMSEAPKKKCPKCGKSKLHRRIGAGAGFLFKGTGFYQTDYRSSEYKADAKKDSGESAPAATTSETKSEAKSETQSETKTETKSAPAPAAKPKKKS
jgi:putative FmdB family regulatory protein